MSLPHCSTIIDYRDITRHLQLLLRREGYIFKSSSEFEVVKSIKEVHMVCEHCFKSFNYTECLSHFSKLTKRCKLWINVMIDYYCVIVVARSNNEMLKQLTTLYQMVPSYQYVCTNDSIIIGVCYNSRSAGLDIGLQNYYFNRTLLEKKAKGYTRSQFILKVITITNLNTCIGIVLLHQKIRHGS